MSSKNNIDRLIINSPYKEPKEYWHYDLVKLIRLVKEFIHSDFIEITPPLFNQDAIRQRILITLNLRKVFQHIWNAIYLEKCSIAFMEKFH